METEVDQVRTDGGTSDTCHEMQKQVHALQAQLQSSRSQNILYAKQLAAQRAAHQTRNVQFKAQRTELLQQRTFVLDELMHNRDLENTNHLTQTAWHDVQTDNRRLQQQVISVMDKQAALQSKLASAQNDARAAQTALQEKEEENATDAQALQSMLWERLEAWAGPEHMPYWCLLRQRLQELDMSFGKNPNGLLYMAVNDLIYYQEEFRALVNDAAAIAWKEFKVDIAKKKKLPHTNKYHALRKQVAGGISRWFDDNLLLTILDQMAQPSPAEVPPSPAGQTLQQAVPARKAVRARSHAQSGQRPPACLSLLRPPSAAAMCRKL